MPGLSVQTIRTVKWRNFGEQTCRMHQRIDIGRCIKMVQLKWFYPLNLLLVGGWYLMEMAQTCLPRFRYSMLNASGKCVARLIYMRNDILVPVWDALNSYCAIGLKVASTQFEQNKHGCLVAGQWVLVLMQGYAWTLRSLGQGRPQPYDNAAAKTDYCMMNVLSRRMNNEYVHGI